MDKSDGRSCNIFGLILSIISIILVVASYPPYGYAWAAWFALAPLFIALMRFAPSGFAFGLYYALTLAGALLGILKGFPQEYKIIYAAPAVVFVVVFLATFWQRKLLQKNNFSYFTIITALGFVACEFLRQYTPLSIFGALGVTQYRNPGVIQIASLVGVFGVTFMLVISNCGIALLIANIRKISAVQVQLSLIVLIIVALTGINSYLLRQPLKINGMMKVGAIQFGYQRNDSDKHNLSVWLEQMEKKDWPGMTRTTLDILEPMTDRATEYGARLVVWPETVLQVDPERYPGIALRLGSLAKRNKIFLVAPYFSVIPGQENEENPEYRNYAAVISPNGRLIYRYEKQHRVTAFDIEKGPSGDSMELISTITGSIGILICYDADFTDVPREYAYRGVEAFVIPSDDMATWLSPHHTAMLLFRAVEYRKSVIKADMVNGTIIVDPKGRILDDPPDGRNIAFADVPLVSVTTPYPWLSIIFGLGCLGSLFIFLFAAWRAKDKSAA